MKMKAIEADPAAWVPFSAYMAEQMVQGMKPQISIPHRDVSIMGRRPKWSIL